MPRMTEFTTLMHLPPGLPPEATLREFFRLVLEEYRWFTPMRYGFASLNERSSSARLDCDALVSFYKEKRAITVAARTDRDFFLVYPSQSAEWPFTGRITWVTSVAEARKPSWRAAHVDQVATLMRLLGSPLAQAGLDDSIQRKTQRLVSPPDGLGQEQVATVRGYGEGLAGLFWRSFYGPPFVRMFGERLASLPEDCRQQLGKELVLVQPYELPTQAGTPEADTRERELISLLGPECFYDFEHHAKPTRVPQLPLGPSH